MESLTIRNAIFIRKFSQPQVFWPKRTIYQSYKYCFRYDLLKINEYEHVIYFFMWFVCSIVLTRPTDYYFSLLVIFGVTSTNKHIYICNFLLSSQKLCLMGDNVYDTSCIFIVNRDLLLMNVIEKVFSTTHNLSMWHISKNVLTRYKNVCDKSKWVNSSEVIGVL